MTTACSPVTVGDQFTFGYKKCIVIKLNKTSFDYKFMNPSYDNRITKRISFVFWQKNVIKRLGDQYILRGGKEPRVIKEEFHKRELKRLKESISILLGGKN